MRLATSAMVRCSSRRRMVRRSPKTIPHEVAVLVGESISSAPGRIPVASPGRRSGRLGVDRSKEMVATLARPHSATVFSASTSSTSTIRPGLRQRRRHQLLRGLVPPGHQRRVRRRFITPQVRPRWERARPPRGGQQHDAVLLPRCPLQLAAGSPPPARFPEGAPCNQIELSPGMPGMGSPLEEVLPDILIPQGFHSTGRVSRSSRRFSGVRPEEVSLLPAGGSDWVNPNRGSKLHRRAPSGGPQARGGLSAG